MLAASTQIAARRMAAASRSVRSAVAIAQRCKSTNVPASAESKELAQQAPNRELTWSQTQRPRADITNDPRFVQVDLDGQPRPMAAIELIAEEPVREVEGRLACCDGGRLSAHRVPGHVPPSDWTVTANVFVLCRRRRPGSPARLDEPRRWQACRLRLL
ncbi:hypothetical protein H4S02_002923 [Coemansia sp. RSA 2611]|nr:hypothetical protein H4S02_002923 [Coemansia sp. RSA 2611]